MTVHENTFSKLMDAAASDSPFFTPKEEEGAAPSRRRRQRRRAVTEGAERPNSDDEADTAAFPASIQPDDNTAPQRSRSLDLSDPSLAEAVAAATAAAGTPQGTFRSDSPALLSPIDRPNSPLLRMLGQHADLPASLLAESSATAAPQQIVSARDPPTNPVSRTLSTPGFEAISAPATARCDGDWNAAAAAATPQPATTGPVAPARLSTPIAAEALISPLPTAPAAARLGGRPLPAPAPAPADTVPHSQSLGDYIAAELHPGPSYPTADVVWGQTERDRVYNALMAVPYQLERLLWLGCAICADSFLAVFTTLPMRVAGAAGAAAGAALGWRRRRKTGAAVSTASTRLRGDQIYDLLCAAMFVALVIFLWKLKAGSIYYWVKDLTQEFLKLSVLQTALELSDKICCSFLVDVLEALAASCTALAAVPCPRRAWNVWCDAAVATALLFAHGTVLVSQALVFGVAMNSQKNTLLALLIASNFTEIKGTVLKRFDPTKLFVLACQDVVERFHMIIVLSFVLVEEMSGTGATLPSSRLLGQCGYVLLAEAAIDVMKHAVLGKFNEIRPGVYREFTKDVCEQLATSQSHTAHRLVGFEPFAPAALFLRVALSYWALRGGWDDPLARGAWSVRGVAVVLAAWAALAAVKVALGFAMKRSAVAYLRRYEALRGRPRPGQNRGRSVGFAVSPAPSPAGAAGVGLAPAKKEN